MKTVFGKMLPQNLTNDQFLRQEPVCINILDKVQTKANSLDKIITPDKSWIFHYNLEGTRQNSGRRAFSHTEKRKDEHIDIQDHDNGAFRQQRHCPFRIHFPSTNCQ
jgi:hypothetical protein